MNPDILVDLTGGSEKIILSEAENVELILLKKRIDNLGIIENEVNGSDVYYGEINKEARKKLKSFNNLTVQYKNITS